MELRSQKSQTGSRKKQSYNDIIINPSELQNNKKDQSKVSIQQSDQFWITFVDEGLLAYSNPIDLTLVLQQNLCPYQFWKALFVFKAIPGSNKFYIIHQQTNLYCSAQQPNFKSQNHSVLSILLTQKCTQYSEFQFGLIHNNKVDKQHTSKVFYETEIFVKNVKTHKNLQITKQQRYPHLSNIQQTGIILKLYKKGKPGINDAWITKQPFKYLQNGDLVMLKNTEQSFCLFLQPKNDFYFKTVDLKSVANHNFLQATNYTLVQKPTNQLNSSNIVYSLWRVEQISFSQKGNKNIYNSDIVIFRHCFINACLVKRYSSQSIFSTNLFDLRNNQQFLIPQVYGFTIRNQILYCFNKNSNDQKNCQPIYINDTIELQFKHPCYLKKIDERYIRYLRLFNQNLIRLTEVLLDFNACRTLQQLNNRKGITQTQKQQKNNKSCPKKRIINQTKPEPYNKNSPQSDQNLTVDYDKLKQFIITHQKITKIIISNQIEQPVYTNFYIMKILIGILEIIGNSLKKMVQIKRRKKPILKPLIQSIYQFFINIITPSYCTFSSSIFNSLKKLIAIDSESTILIIYYLSRIWNLDNSIDVFIQLIQQVEPEEEELILVCLIDIIQHCCDWKDQYSYKIKQMLISVGFSLSYNQDEGICLSHPQLGTISVLDFQQKQKKSYLFLYLKIAIFSEVLTNNSSISNQQILMQLIFQLQNKKQMKNNQTIYNIQSQQKISQKKSLTILNKKQIKNIYEKANLLQIINYYLLNVYACSISTLKIRKFVILNQRNIDLQMEQSDIQSKYKENSQKEEQQFSMMMLKFSTKKLSKQKCQLDEDKTSKRKTKSYIKQNTNVYPFLNYEEVPLPIIQISKHLQSILQNLQIWDSTHITNSENLKNIRIISSALRLQKPKNDKQKVKTICLKQKLNCDTGFQSTGILHKDSKRQHLYLMVQSFNTVISVTDIVISTGYITLKNLSEIQLFILCITNFMLKVKLGQNKSLCIQSQFFKKYPTTATELMEYYQEKTKNKGLTIQQILIEQKIKQLFLSINQIFNIILMVKKRLISHPAIQIVDRHSLFNFEKCLTQYLDIYTFICQEEYYKNKKLIKNQQLNLEILAKLLNFYYGNYYNPGEQIILLNIQSQNQKSTKIKKNIASIQKIKESYEIFDETISHQKISEQRPKIKISKLATNRQIFLKYSPIFKNCQEIVYNLELLNSVREKVEKQQIMRNTQTSKSANNIKKFLDLIIQKLNDLRKNKQSNIDSFIIRAYKVSEKLVENIFNTQYFEEDFISQILKFLCQTPPQFYSFSIMHSKLSYSLPLTKIFIKSLQNHLQTILKQTTLQFQVIQTLKQAVSIIIRVIQNCRKQLKPKEFILVMGILCQVFPNRVVSEKIYHTLLQIHAQQRKNTIFGFSQKKSCRQLLFNTNFKEQVNAPKKGFGQIMLGHKSRILCPSAIMDAYKTLQTFKELVTQAQNQQDKIIESGINSKQNSKQNGSFSQVVSAINKHISLIFRLCQNSDQVYRHFTQNIIKYDSLLLIAFDPQIPLKYKIPLPIYFRNDDRIYNDQVAISDYLIWISSVLKDYELYLHQLAEYINQNNTSYYQFHNHDSSKIIRQRQNPKVSLLFDHSQHYFSQNISSSKLVSNVKILQHQYYYWQLLFSQPFLHQQEGILVFLQKIITNMKQIYLMQANNTQKQSINKSVAEIYQSLSSLYKTLTQKKYKVKTTHLKFEIEDQGISCRFIRKIRKNLKLILQKYPSLRDLHIKDDFGNQNIAFSIVNTLLNYNLLKKFIKVFYYNDYRNINLPLFYDKKTKQLNSNSSDGSEMSFKNSRSSKMSQQSNNDFRIAEMAILKKSLKEVSIKQFQIQQEDGCRSNNTLILHGDRYLARKLTHTPNTIKVNFNTAHYFEQRAYMFYEVSKLLDKVCELIQNPQLKSRLEEQFILFFQYNGNSKILKDQIIGVLKYLRQDYLKKNSQNPDKLQQSGFIKLIKPFNSFTFSQRKQNNPQQLIIMIKNLVFNYQIYIAIQLLKSILQKQNKKNSNQLSLIYLDIDSNIHKKFILNQLISILKFISLEPVTQLVDYCKYLRLLKYIFLVFLFKEKIEDQSIELLQKQISNLLAQYINKILLMAFRFHLKNPTKKSQAIHQRQQKGKKQTIISQVNKIREISKLQNLDSFQKKLQGVKRQNTNQSKQKNNYLPEMQVQFYLMIELYAITQARMKSLQKQLYCLISSKILNMVYGMTLSRSLKLILKSLVQKCGFSSSIPLQDIISSNKKLQYFIQLKIQQMSDPKNLISSNMSVSENLSFISIYYDYIYRLFWDEFLLLNNTQHQQNIETPKISNQIWQAVATLQQNIILLLYQQKQHQNKLKLFQRFSKKNRQNFVDNQQDFERFRLLHKILSQSINLFNIRFVIDKLRKEFVRVNKVDVTLEVYHENIYVWNLHSFIQSRTSLFSSSQSQKRIKIYTKLFKNLTHVLLTFKQTESKLLYSFIDENLTCSAIFNYKNDQIDNKSSNNYFQHKRYKNDWNCAVIDIISQPMIDNICDTQIEPDCRHKQNKIFYISEYVIQQTNQRSYFYSQIITNQVFSKVCLIIPLIFACINIILIFWQMQYSTQSQIQILLQKLIRYLCGFNFVFFVLLCLNRLILYWKISKLRTYMKQRIQKTLINPKTSNLSKISIIKMLIMKYIFILIIMLILLIISCILPAGNKKLIPLMFLQIFFISQSLLSRTSLMIYKFVRASWVPVLIMFLSVWLIYYYKLIFNRNGNRNAFTMGQDETVGDISMTFFIKYISGKSTLVFQNWVVFVIQNVFIYGCLIVLTASALGHLQWCLENKDLPIIQKQLNKCLICQKTNQMHIMYSHNVINWIDLQVNIKCRNSSSLSYLQLFLRNQIQNQDLSIFGYPV